MNVTMTPQWSPPPPAAPIRRRGPRRMAVLGIILSVVGWGAFVVGFVLMALNMFETVKEGLDPERKLELSVAVPGEGSVDLEPGRYQVVALGDTLTSVSGRSSDAGGLNVHRLPFAEPPVTVTAPDGSAVTLEAPTADRLSHAPGLDAVGIREFDVTTAGSYTLSVAGEAGAVSKVGIGEAESMWEAASSWITSSAVIAIGGILGGIGMTVLIMGVVWSAMSRATAGAFQHFR